MREIRQVIRGAFWVYVAFCLSISLSCGGEISVTPGCESCPRLCVTQEKESKGRCVACLKDSDCQSATSPTKKCTAEYLCICGGDKDCPDRQFCKGKEGCVECLNNQQCAAQSPERPNCVNNRCEICVSTQSRSCSPDGPTACKEGQQTCSANGLWGKCEGAIVCKNNERCDRGTCVVDCPADACKETTSECASRSSETPGRFKVCQKNAAGCGVWSEEKSCKVSEICENGQCRPYNCPSPPCQVGETRCLNGSQSQTCQRDQHGCWGWGSAATCAQGESCSASLGRCANCTPGERKDCYSGSAVTQNVGICRIGKKICKADGSGFEECFGEVLPSAERCNGLDDDCDGQIDQDLTKPCYTGTLGTQGIGECRAGTQTCNNGVWGGCSGEVTPQQDTCGDKKDNDCNGQIDDGPGCCAAGGVLNLTGASYVEIPVHRNTFQLQQTLTIEAWVYITGTPPYPGNPRAFSKGLTGSSYEDYNIAFCTSACSTSPKPGGTLKNASGRNIDFTANNGVGLNTWVHVALAYNGTNGSLYVNGVLSQTSAVAGPITATTNHKVYFGRSGGPHDQFTGFLDEIRVWSVARSQQEIAAFMGRRLAGNETGLVGYWNFDANNANDLTSQQNHGTLHGGASIIPATGQAWCQTP